jgi:UDP-glucuronate 4-epimerase
MSILVTGSAGFIGYHATKLMLERGMNVVGVDNINSYYSTDLKKARLAQLRSYKNFTFIQDDIADLGLVDRILQRGLGIEGIIHLAAQAGVRHSLTHPFDYIHSNVVGHMNMMELARRSDDFKHFVYASSSSVYGGNQDLPFSVESKADSPLSPYGASKKAAELFSHSYSYLYGIPMTGLRFFTVYGPWGRPDMAAYLFADAIYKGEPINVYNNGDMRRDFTYVDDIVEGVLACYEHPQQSKVPHKIYNLGNNNTESLTDFIACIEKAIGKKAVYNYLPMQPGDVQETYADITSSQQDFGFEPKVSIKEGIPKFIEWFKSYHGIENVNDIKKVG